MDKLFKFLLGESHFDGYYFNDKSPPFEGIFWWRKHLSKWLSENPTCTATERAFLDELREKGKIFGADDPAIEVGEWTQISQSDFTKCNLKELVNEI